MNTILAIISMENGMKVAKIEWKEEYLFIDENGDIRWNNGKMYYEHMNLEDQWKIVD